MYAVRCGIVLLVLTLASGCILGVSPESAEDDTGTPSDTTAMDTVTITEDSGSENGDTGDPDDTGVTRDSSVDTGPKGDVVDASDACDPVAWYPDSDGDGFGADTGEEMACETPGPKFVMTGGDCDDEDAEVHPNHDEVCDFKDNNCKGGVDEGTCKPYDAPCSEDRECISRACIGDKNEKTCAQTILVTSQTFTGGFGGLPSAKMICNNVGLDGEWGAVLSTSVLDANNSVGFHFPLHNRRGQKVADDSDDLWKESTPPHLVNAVKYDENGREQSTKVWTGTKEDGQKQETCVGNVGTSWNERSDDPGSEAVGSVGLSDEKSADWVFETRMYDCEMKAALYCVDGQTL